MEQLSMLTDGRLFAFADWPNKEVPQFCAGVYTIWDHVELLA
jgi:hypothetical protein